MDVWKTRLRSQKPALVKQKISIRYLLDIYLDAIRVINNFGEPDA
jgi:hypothetical protein